MFKRIATSIVGIPLLALLLILGGYPLQIAVALIVLIGMMELYKAMSGKIQPVHYIGYVFALLYMFFIDKIANSTAMNVISMCLILAVMGLLVVCHKTINIMDCTITVFGFYYVAVLLSTVFLARSAPNGIYTVWLIFLSAWGSDTGAYFTGITIGKHKLIPTLSPNKTIEGSIGGILLATAFSALYAAVLHLVGVVGQEAIWSYAIIGFVGSILAQFGDLSASAIKRYAKIKDFGKIIPGHGGIIDRFDSILFTAPVVFLLAIILLK